MFGYFSDTFQKIFLYLPHFDNDPGSKSTGKKRCFLAYHVMESYGKHDLSGKQICRNWHNTWMFPTAFQNN